MNEQERRSNHILYALDEAHRMGRITRAEYRARRRALLASLSDSNGVTARNAILPGREPAPRRVESTRGPAAAVDEAATLFPERRAALRKLWLVTGGMVLVAMLLVYWMLRRSSP
jgi:hypothetical protein